MGRLFQSLRKCHLFIFIPTTGFLDHFLSPLQEFCLSFEFVLNSLPNSTERVYVLYLDFGSHRTYVTNRTYTNVCLNSHLALFHIGIRNIKVLEKELKLFGKMCGFLGRMQTWFRNQLHEWYPHSVKSAIFPPTAVPTRRTFLTASLFMTGNVPG